MKSQHQQFLVAATLVAVLFAGYLGTVGSSEPNMGPVKDRLQLQNLSAVKISEDLKISLTAMCAGGEAVAITEFKINTVSQLEISGLTIYINGSLIDHVKLPQYVVKNGDTVIVNLILPKTIGIIPQVNCVIRGM